MYLSNIITITNNNGENTSPWKIPLWIFTYAQVFPLAVNSTFQFFMNSVMNFMILSDIEFILRQSSIEDCRTISLAYLKSIHALVTFFSPRFFLLQEVVINVQ